MKRKFVGLEVYKNVILPNSEWSFRPTSPIPQVSTPKALFTAIAGVSSSVSGPSIAMGTMEVCRQSNSTIFPLKFDKHVFYSTGTPSLLEIVEVNKRNIPYHWTEQLPHHLRDAAPPGGAAGTDKNHER